MRRADDPRLNRDVLLGPARSLVVQGAGPSGVFDTKHLAGTSGQSDDGLHV
jgi:hypothetical protein